jgi:hypothetical protein
LFGAIVVLVVVANLGGGDRSSSDSANAPPALISSAAEDCDKAIVYFVEGTASAVSITVQNAEGNTEQASNRAVPLSGARGEGLRIGSMACGDFVYISAQNEGESGSVTCRIEADGEEIESATSEGAYVIASCSGTVPFD